MQELFVLSNVAPEQDLFNLHDDKQLSIDEFWTIFKLFSPIYEEFNTLLYKLLFEVELITFINSWYVSWYCVIKPLNLLFNNSISI